MLLENPDKGKMIFDVQLIKYISDDSWVSKTLADLKNVNFHNGAGMLVEQAAECFHLWFNEKPNTKEVKIQLNEGF